MRQAVPILITSGIKEIQLSNGEFLIAAKGADKEKAFAMTTLKEFEAALREQGMRMALAILGKLRERDRAERSIAPARRITGRKMTPELAHHILELHRTTAMTQQEIAFQLGVNQGRVNEVIKHGRWLSGDPQAPEAIARDQAKRRAQQGIGKTPRRSARRQKRGQRATNKSRRNTPSQLTFGL
jgi:hypothetical protein